MMEYFVGIQGKFSLAHVFSRFKLEHLSFRTARLLLHILTITAGREFKELLVDLE